MPQVGVSIACNAHKIGMTRRPALNRVDVIGISVYASKDLLNWQNEGPRQPGAVYHSQHVLCQVVAGMSNMEVLYFHRQTGVHICMGLDLKLTGPQQAWLAIGALADHAVFCMS